MEPLVLRPRDQETMGSGNENGFSHHCAFVWTGKNGLTTQRLDADFFEHGEKTPQLSNKNDYMSLVALEVNNTRDTSRILLSFTLPFRILTLFGVAVLTR